MGKMSLRAKAYIILIIVTGLIIFASSIFHVGWQFPWPILILSILGSLSLIFKVEGATVRLHYNLSLLVYSFTFITLGFHATAVVILVSHLVEWIWHKYPWYIQFFNISAYISSFFVGMSIHSIFPVDVQSLPYSEAILWGFTLITIVITNHLLVGIVVWLARGENFKESGIFNFIPLMIDFAMLCMGITGGLLWGSNPYLTLFILVPLYLIYNTLQIPSLERKTEIDSKTGLYNARHFEKVLNNELKRADRFDRPLTIIMADLDLLRNINNTYGHLAGDVVLIGIAKILKDSMREYDLVARFGGEEFSIIIPESTPQQVFERVETIRRKIESTGFEVQTSVVPIQVTMSFGVACRENHGQTSSEILHNADMALYRAKLHGRNRTNIFSNDEKLDNLLNGMIKSPPISATPAKDRAVKEKAATATPPAGLLKNGKAAEGIRPNPGNHKNNRPAWLVNVYIFVLASTAILLTGITLRPIQNTDWLGLGLFGLVLILAEGFSVEIYTRESAISTSAVPMLAGVLLFGPPGALIMSMTFAAVTMIKHRSKWNRFVFNTSNQLIAGLLYFIIFNLDRMPYLAQPMWKQIFICLAAAGIVFLFTTWTIAIAISIDSNLSLKQIWMEKFCWLAPYYLGMGLIAFGLTFAFHYQGIWGVLMIISPLFLLRLSQVQFIDRTRSVVTELKEKNQVLENSSQEIHSLNQALFNTLAEVIDLRDPFVLGHSKKVAYLASAIAKKFKLPEKKIELIYRAGLLHDIGKIGISDSILQKPFPLTNEEIKKIEKHPELGANLLKTSQILANLIPIIRHHHERYDGTGYPAGLKGNEIPLEARILTIADAIEAMISNRPYRNGLTNHALLDQIESGSGSQFDPQVASVTIDLLRSEGEKLIPGFTDLNIYDYPSEQLELTFSENSAVLVQNHVLRQ